MGDPFSYMQQKRALTIISTGTKSRFLLAIHGVSIEDFAGYVHDLVKSAILGPYSSVSAKSSQRKTALTP